MYSTTYGRKTMKKKIIIVVSVIIGVVLVVAAAGGIYTFSLLNKVKKQELPKTNEELGIVEKPEEKKDDSIVNIALFGLDRRDPDQASRSDSIMVLTIDNKHKKIKLASLMRDMYVNIPEKGENRINAAYAFGGPGLAVKTINSNFDLDIKNYASIDFFGLEKLIDKVGGVNINVSDAEAKVLNQYLKELNKLNGDTVPDVSGGEQVLNGRQAVAYSRIRYVGNADYERTERQRRVLGEVFKKASKVNPVSLPGIISTALPYVETSLSNGDILDLSMKAMKFGQDELLEYRLPVDGTFKGQKIRGMSVLVPDIEENTKLLHKFIYEE
jgi:LCP family protein required for cell wall assembly